MIKPGKVYYGIVHDDNGKPSFDEWVVRTVRGGKVTAILKASFTWGKRSTKAGDYGWLPRIPAWCRTTWRIDREPFGIFTTKLQAVRHELKTTEPDDFDQPEQYDRFMAGLKRMKT